MEAFLLAYLIVGILLAIIGLSYNKKLDDVIANTLAAVVFLALWPVFIGGEIGALVYRWNKNRKAKK